jgi:transposase InsO family protein
VIEQLKRGYSVRQVCATLDCPVSTAYYKPVDREEGDLVAAIEGILMQFPFYGYRKIYRELQRQGWDVGEHRVRRLLGELDRSRSVGQVRVQTTDSRHTHPRYPNRIKGVTVARPDQVWVADITYIRLGRRFIYLAVILDAYTRAVRGWAVSTTIDHRLTLAALEMALENSAPFIFHSDQGSQYACWQHTERLLMLGVKISMSDTGQPSQNGLVERFIRTVKEEHVDYSDYEDFQDAYRQLKHWLEVVYMTQRIHQALDYLTPAEFEMAALANASYPLLSPV